MNDNEPIIIGKVEKGKTGKPLVVVIIFLFIGAALFFLPTLAGYFGEYKVIELIKNGQIVDFFINHDYYMSESNNKIINTTTQVIANDKPVLINNKTIIKYNNFTLTNFDIKTTEIKFIVTTSNTIDFNNSNYYLVLYQNDKEIEKLKLINEITTSGEMTLSFSKTLENTVEITGIIKEVKESTTTTTTTTTTAITGVPLICYNETNEIEYIFTQTFLTSIKDTFKYTNKQDGTDLGVLEEYKRKSEEIKLLGAESTITEKPTGFEMITIIDLSRFQYNNNINNNYYPLNSQRLKIMTEMGEKGYNCTIKE